MFRRRRAPLPPRRRTGPADEEPWWDPADQAFAERPVFQAKVLGWGWQSVEIPNNDERLDPYLDDEPHSDALRTVRARRRLTALDEGWAWRHRDDRSLVVSRVEVFERADVDGAHRSAWREHGTGCLDAVWRARWRERGREPGWIEARWAVEPLGADVDRIVVEDQTGVHETGNVVEYQHLTVWSGRAVATVTIRHDQAVDIGATVRTVADHVPLALADLDRAGR